MFNQYRAKIFCSTIFWYAFEVDLKKIEKIA